MKHYVLLYEVVSDYAARRAPFRDEHLGLVHQARARGDVVMAGALGDPPDGALLIFQAESPSIVEAFALADPYVRHGLVTAWSVRPWNVVVGREA